MNLNLKVKTPGQKTITVAPELVIGPTHNRIIANQPLAHKLGIEEGDYAVILSDDDTGTHYLGRVSSEDGESGKIAAARAAGKGSVGFSYAGPWLELFTKDLDEEMDISTAIRKGLLVKKTSGTGYYTTRKVRYNGEIIELDEPVEINGVTFNKLFELGEPLVEAYNYSGNSKSDNTEVQADGDQHVDDQDGSDYDQDGTSGYVDM